MEKKRVLAIFLSSKLYLDNQINRETNYKLDLVKFYSTNLNFDKTPCLHEVISLHKIVSSQLLF